NKTDTTPAKPLFEMIGVKQDSAKPLIIVDEVESKAGMPDLNPNVISWINVLKEAPAFGPQGRNGVILIYRKNYKAAGVVRLKDGTKVKVDPAPGMLPGKGGHDTLRAEPAGADRRGDGVIVHDTVNTGGGGIVRVPLKAGDLGIVHDTLKPPVVESGTGES